MSSLSSLSGLIGLAAILIGGIPLLLGGVLVILVVANRAEPDPTGRRPAVVYMLAMSFATLFITLFATFTAVHALFSLMGTTHAGGDSLHPVGDRVARTVVLSLLIAVVAGGLLLVHLRGAIGDRVDGTAGVVPDGPVGRVWQSYSGAVSFVGVLILLVATVVAIYQVFRIAGPGVFSPGDTNRVEAWRELLPTLYLAGAAMVVVLAHQGVLGPLRSMGIKGPFSRMVRRPAAESLPPPPSE